MANLYNRIISRYELQRRSLPLTLFEENMKHASFVLTHGFTFVLTCFDHIFHNVLCSLAFKVLLLLAILATFFPSSVIILNDPV